MKNPGKRNFWISLIFGAVLFGVLAFLTGFSMYIPWIYSVNQLVLNAGVCVLVSMILYKMLCRESTAESFGTYLWFLAILTLGNWVFTVMHYSAWVCLGLNAVALLKLLGDFLVDRFGETEVQ